MQNQRLAQEKMRQIGDLFAIGGKFVSGEEIQTGLINTSVCLSYVEDDGVIRRYLIQRINEQVFPRPGDVMQNIKRVTRHVNDRVLRSKRDFSGQSLNLCPAKTGEVYAGGPNGGTWRCYRFIEGCRTYDQVQNEHQAYQAAYAFGAFSDLLSDLDPTLIVETIPDFHHTPKRYQQLVEAVENDVAGRVKSVQPELEFLASQREQLSRLVDMQAEGILPVRIVHNDTKINNVMINAETDEAVCVIDLDTVMPGVSLYDFGDMVRSAANETAEDDGCIENVGLSMPIFKAMVNGYLDACPSLTAEEINEMVFSVKLCALELCTRFLADYLNGDVYFKTTREHHNLDRARNQLRLAQCVDESSKEMQEVVKVRLAS